MLIYRIHISPLESPLTELFVTIKSIAGCIKVTARVQLVFSSGRSTELVKKGDITHVPSRPVHFAHSDLVLKPPRESRTGRGVVPVLQSFTASFPV